MTNGWGEYGTEEKAKDRGCKSCYYFFAPWPTPECKKCNQKYSQWRFAKILTEENVCGKYSKYYNNPKEK